MKFASDPKANPELARLDMDTSTPEVIRFTTFVFSPAFCTSQSVEAFL